MNFEPSIEYLKRRKQHVCMVCANGLLNDSRVLKTASTLRKSGFRVTLYGMKRADTGKEPEIIDGFDFNVIRTENPAFSLKKNNKWNSSFKDYGAFSEGFANDILSDSLLKNFDILYTHDMFGMSVGGFLRKHHRFSSLPWIHDVHEYVAGLDVLDESLLNFALKAEEENIGNVDIVTTVSNTLASRLHELYSLKNCLVVHNCPRLGDFDDSYKSLHEDLELNSSVKLISYHGNVKKERGIIKFVEMFEFLPEEYRGVIISDSKGSYVDSVQDLASIVAPGKIYFKPYVPAHRVSSYLRTSYASIHTIDKYPNSEVALPNKLFESLHAGIPFVCPPLEAMSDFVRKNKNGVVSKENSAASLAEAVMEIGKRFIVKNDYDLSYRYSWEKAEVELIGLLDSFFGIDSHDDFYFTKSKGRVCQLPANSAGQPVYLAEALRKGGWDAFSFLISSKNPFQYSTNELSKNSDLLKLTKSGTKNIGNLFSFLKSNSVLSNVDVFHFHARSLWYTTNLSIPYVSSDLFLLKNAGSKVYFHFRGSEARIKRIFKQKNPYAWFHVTDDESLSESKRSELLKQCPYEFKEEHQEKFIEKAKEFCDEVFVVDPEVGTYVPNGTIVPRVVGLDIYKKGAARKYNQHSFSSKPIVIAHAPSRPFIKGTSEIIEAVELLKSKGYNVELDLITNTPHSEAIERYNSADILIDQLRIGWFGVLSVEAMALGVPVVCFIRDDLLHNLPLERPLINANLDNLVNVLLKYINNPKLLTNISERARDYIQKVHHPDAVYKMLNNIYSDHWKEKKHVGKINNLKAFLPSFVDGFEKKPLVKKESNKSNEDFFIKALRFDQGSQYPEAIKFYNKVYKTEPSGSSKGMYSLSRIKYLSSFK